MTRNKCARAGRTRLSLSIVLCLAMQASSWGFAGGTGEPNDPYRIATAEQLLSIGSDPSLLNRHYVLTADIDLAGHLFTAAVIAPDTDRAAGFDGPSFTGTFNGRGHTISGLSIDARSTGGDFLALFGRIGNGGRLLYLGVPDGFITGGRSVQNVGILAGDNDGLIYQCYAGGVISGADWSDLVGGLAGSNSGVLSQSYATTRLSAGPFSNLAGLVGSNAGVVHQCYAAGAVARATFGQSGGLTNLNSGLLTDCYFLRSDDGGGPDNGLGAALTGAQMKDAQRLHGFDFLGRPSDGRLEAWALPADAYPVLAWQTDVTGLVWRPDLRSMPVAEVRAALENAGLVVAQISHDFDHLVPAGSVVAVLPSHPVAPGTAVTLLVSEGPYDWQQNPGDGTRANPYRIGSAGQLDSLRHHPALWTGSFVLTTSIDMTDRLYHDAVIAAYPHPAEVSFAGSFDGGKFEISGLTIVSAGDYVGLFGQVSGPSTQEIRDLVLTNAYVLARSTGSADSLGGTGLLAGSSSCTLVDCSVDGTVVGLWKVGGLVGRNTGIITRCVAEAAISGTEYLGGLTGHAFGGTISLCYTDGDIIGTGESLGGLAGYVANSCRVTQCLAAADVSGLNRVGGLAGYFHTGTIIESLATGDVSGVNTVGGLVGYADSSIGQCFAMGRVSGRRHVGGLVGYGRSSLTQCYATGDVSGEENVGGLAGFTDFSASVAECYAAGAVAGNLSIGGLLGFKTDSATVANSFWDVRTSGISAGSYGAPLTTTQMHSGNTFKDAGWDFARTWTICEGKDYPRFQWEAVECN